LWLLLLLATLRWLLPDALGGVPVAMGAARRSEGMQPAAQRTTMSAVDASTKTWHQIQDICTWFWQ
jgi:hypothetical protein